MTSLPKLFDTCLPRLGYSQTTLMAFQCSSATLSPCGLDVYGTLPFTLRHTPRQAKRGVPLARSEGGPLNRDAAHELYDGYTMIIPPQPVAKAAMRPTTAIPPTASRVRRKSRKLTCLQFASWTPKGIKTELPIIAPQIVGSRQPASLIFQSQLSAPINPPAKKPIAPPRRPVRVITKSRFTTIMLLMAEVYLPTS